MAGKQPDLQPSGVKLKLSHIYSKANTVSTSSTTYWASQVAQCKESTCQCMRPTDTGVIPGSGRPPGEGNGNPLQYSCLGNPTDIGAWRATVRGVTKSQTQLSNLAHACKCTHTYIHTDTTFNSTLIFLRKINCLYNQKSEQP